MTPAAPGLPIPLRYIPASAVALRRDFCGGSAPEWHACACRKLLNPSQLALTAALALAACAPESNTDNPDKPDNPDNPDNPEEPGNPDGTEVAM